MMSRYSEGKNYAYEDDHSNSSSPRGRRYILKNLNTKKLRQLEYLDTSRKVHNGYTNLATAPSSVASVATNNSNKPVGTANKVMPTNTVSKTPSPKKTPRAPPIFVAPKKGNNPKESTNKESNTVEKKTPRKGETETKSNQVKADKKNEHGLTPRDEYMVTKLYEQAREIIYLKPSEVRYTHDQITAHFSDGRSMLSTFIALLYGRVEIRLGGNDVPPIEVMQTTDTENGREEKLWYAVNGNRRLYVFRRLERCGAITTMQVIARKYDSIEMDKQFLTRNHGRSIAVTNDATLNAKFSKEVTRWKEWKAKQPKQKPVKGKQGGNPRAGGANTRAGGAAKTNSSCCTIL